MYECVAMLGAKKVRISRRMRDPRPVDMEHLAHLFGISTHESDRPTIVRTKPPRAMCAKRYAE